MLLEKKIRKTRKDNILCFLPSHHIFVYYTKMSAKALQYFEGKAKIRQNIFQITENKKEYFLRNKTKQTTYAYIIILIINQIIN